MDGILLRRAARYGRGRRRLLEDCDQPRPAAGQVASGKQNGRVSRRDFLRAAALSQALALIACGRAREVDSVTSRPTDIRIDDVSCGFEDYRYRRPYKFGGHEVDRATVLNVHCAVRTAGARGGGGAAKGFGSMTLGNVWSFPSLPYDVSLGAMKALAGRIRTITADYKGPGHPIDIHAALQPAYVEATSEVPL